MSGPASDMTGNGSYAHADPVADAALEWWMRLREPADPAEQGPELFRDFQQWLEQDARHAREFDALERIWGSDLMTQALDVLPRPAKAAVAAGDRMDAVVVPLVDRAAARKRSGLAKFGAWGGGLAASFLLGMALWQGPDLLINWRSAWHTAAGEIRNIDLPDGSVMLLNTHSAVSLDFTDGRRDVTLLRGEAWFDVRHDPAHPFRVSGGFGTAEVKGTTFALRRFEDHDQITLEQGRVEVSCQCDDAPVVDLTPDKAVSVTDAGPGLPVATDAAGATSWREGRLSFVDAPLSDVADELSRYSGEHIIIARTALRGKRVSGDYQLADTRGAFSSLAVAVGAKIVRLPGRVVILR